MKDKEQYSLASVAVDTLRDQIEGYKNHCQVLVKERDNAIANLNASMERIKQNGDQMEVQCDGEKGNPNKENALQRTLKILIGKLNGRELEVFFTIDLESINK